MDGAGDQICDRVEHRAGLGAEEVGASALQIEDAMQAASQGSAAAQSSRGRLAVQIRVSSDGSRHRTQDLQSLALHRAAVHLVKSDAALLAKAEATLERWLANENSRSRSLWLEWREILGKRTWRKILGRTRRAQELRQASPLITVLPEATRRNILRDVSKLRKGVILGDLHDRAAS